MNSPSATNWASASFTQGMRATGASPSRVRVTTVDTRRMRASGTASSGVNATWSGLNESGVLVVLIVVIVTAFPVAVRKEKRPPITNVCFVWWPQAYRQGAPRGLLSTVLYEATGPVIVRYGLVYQASRFLA